MGSAYVLGQLAFSLVVLALIAERAWVLLWRAPTSEAGYRWLTSRLRQGELEEATAFARQRADTYAARLILSGEQGDESDPNLLRMDLRQAASARLALLRGCATLASVLGLLGGILAIRGGFSGQAGLLELQAGLAQQLALAEALERMAIGVGTSAVCFYALGIFRRVARDLIVQSTQIAHLIADQASRPHPGGTP